MAAPNKKAQLGIIFLTVFIDLIGFGIVIPVLPLYAKHFGATESINGILVGIYSAMQFLCAPLLGRLSDRVGRRPVLLVSLLGTCVGFAIMGFAKTLVWLFVARIIDGISGGNISTAQAYIADITEPEERSKTMGLIGAAFGLGFILGPAIGGLLAGVSIGAPFIFASALALLNAILVAIRLPESLSPEHRVSAEDAAPISQVFKHGWHLPALMAGYFFAICGFAMMTTNFALFTHERFGYDIKQNGYVFAFIGVIAALVQGGLLRQLLKRQSEKSLAVLGVLMLAVGMAFLPLVHTLTTLLIVSALVGIGNSFVTPTLNGLASRSAERSWQGRVIGLMQSAGSLARWVGPFLAGKLLSMDVGHAWYGRTPFWTASVILVVALIITLQLPAKPITAASSTSPAAA
jgi:MFS transporter, DHA1 family, tetracycline resistance protein